MTEFSQRVVDITSPKYSDLEITEPGPRNLLANALDRSTGDKVFIKAASSALDGLLKRDLVNGAEIFEEASHPQIPGFKDFFDHDEAAILVIEFKPTVDIVGWFKNNPNPLGAAKVCSSVLAPVGYLHSRNILHNDIHEGNILMSSIAEPYLTDFDYSRRNREFFGTDLSAMGVMLRRLAFDDNPVNDAPAALMNVIEKARHEDYESADEMSHDLNRFINPPVAKSTRVAEGLAVLRPSFAAA